MNLNKEKNFIQQTLLLAIPVALRTGKWMKKLTDA